MRLRDIMTTNVVVIDSKTLLPDAGAIMKAHRIQRLPIVDKGKLIGLVTKDGILRVKPSPVDGDKTKSPAKLTVKDIMVTNLVTATPDITVESAIVLAQNKKVGCLPVMEYGKLVGIVTTDDYISKLLSPLLGIGEPGSRITVVDLEEGPGDKPKIYDVIAESGAKIMSSLYLTFPDIKQKQLLIHLDVTDATSIVKELQGAGYSAEIRVSLPE